jgi:hypothetical protein
MATTMEDLSREIAYLRDEVEQLGRAVYGDSREKINGGGLYGEVRRMRRDLEAAGVERHRQIEDLKTRIIWLFAALSVIGALLAIHALMGILIGT